MIQLLKKFKWWLIGLIFPMAFAATQLSVPIFNSSNVQVYTTCDLNAPTRLLRTDFENKTLKTKNLDGSLRDVTALDKANIKGCEIAKLKSIPRINVENYDIEITDLKPIQGGVEALVRAWDVNGQIGFGEDGSVDLERIIFINPPILVPDGTKKTLTDELHSFQMNNYKEDAKGAILIATKMALDSKKQKFGSQNIISGKIGNTTTTVRPDPDPETTSVDGIILQPNTDVNCDTWATIHDATGGGTAIDNGVSNHMAHIRKQKSSCTNGPGYMIRRSFFLFDTASIPDTDTINSATLKITGIGALTEFTITARIYTSTPDSNTAIVATDFDNFGTTAQDTAGITNLAWATAGVNTFTLNSTGLGNISKTGITKFGMRDETYDVLNVDPGTANPEQSATVQGDFADVAGTADDPVLTVEHTGVATAVHEQDALFFDGE